MRYILSLLLRLTLNLAVLSTIALLSGCGQTTSTPFPIPAAGNWVTFGSHTGAVPSVFRQVNGLWQFAWPSKARNSSVNYAYTKAPALKAGQTITLTYSIDGDATFGTVDGGNPRIHLFIWEAGDNLSCVGGYASYRWWSPTGNPVQIGDKQVSTVLIDQSTWTNCYGEVDPAGFAKALANAQSVGFNFGGTFFGHGVWTTSGSATFTINSFTIQ